MKKYLSLPTVLAALALFVSLSGTAAASIIISSNHQVASHVIAGANAPSGDNKNLVLGSVGGADLHANAVSGAKVADGSLSGADVKNGSLTGSDLANGSVGYGKLKLPKISWSRSATDPIDTAPHHTALSIDGVTIGVSCRPDTNLSVLEVFVTSASGGTMRGSYTLGSDGTTGNTLTIVDKTVSSTAVRFAAAEHATLVGQFTYSNSSRVIAFTLDGAALDGSPGSCNLHGVAVPAPN